MQRSFVSSMNADQRLRQAVVSGNLANVKRLLGRFPDLWLNGDPDHLGWTNLHYALYHGHYLICFYLVRFLTSRGGLSQYSYLDLVLFDNLSALHVLAMRQHHQVLNYLLQELPPGWVNNVGGQDARTPLHYCCVNGFSQGVRLLLEFGADYNLVDAHGDGCLHLCFQFEQMGCVEALLKFIQRQSITPGGVDGSPGGISPDSLTDKPGDQNGSDKESLPRTPESTLGPVSIVDAIERLEATKNKRGFVPTEYIPLFEAGQCYSQLKHDIMVAPAPQTRAHSLLLPTAGGAELARPALPRKRLATTAVPPSRPAPSIKLVTISPSIRKQEPEGPPLPPPLAYLADLLPEKNPRRRRGSLGSREPFSFLSKLTPEKPQNDAAVAAAIVATQNPGRQQASPRKSRPGSTRLAASRAVDSRPLLTNFSLRKSKSLGTLTKPSSSLSGLHEPLEVKGITFNRVRTLSKGSQ